MSVSRLVGDCLLSLAVGVCEEDRHIIFIEDDLQGLEDCVDCEDPGVYVRLEHDLVRVLAHKGS